MAKKKAAAAVTLPEHRIETRAVADLVPAGYNPRTISPEALAGLTASVGRFGSVQPIIVNDRTGRIVGGHQRLKALQQLGQTETTVIVVDLPEIEEKALNVALNNPATSGEFDGGIGSILDEINAALPDLFTDLRLDHLLDESPPRHDAAPQGDGAEDQSDQLRDRYYVIVECTDEAQQVVLLTRLNEEGLVCRAQFS